MDNGAAYQKHCMFDWGRMKQLEIERVHIFRGYLRQQNEATLKAARGTLHEGL